MTDTLFFSVKDRSSFIQAYQESRVNDIIAYEEQLVAGVNPKLSPEFYVDGFCEVCDESSEFLVDLQSGGTLLNEVMAPNYRERLVCSKCELNTRQRLVAALVKRWASDRVNDIYFMEQVTPIFSWATQTLSNANIIGSEYLGPQFDSGVEIAGVRHEDVEQLSFADESLDMIVSNDVFEHVPNPSKAFEECSRVLRKGGQMLATFPFHADKDASVTRAKFVNGDVKHILEPQFHGNPVSDEGSLVFTDFGFDVLGDLVRSGFASANVEGHASETKALLGGVQLIFRCVK